MTTQLKIYNGALRILGEPRLASLSEDRAPRYILDEVWNDDFTRGCLEKGQWRFATKTVQMDADTSIEPDFGHEQVFALPDDYVRIVGISPDPFFRDTLLDYAFERRYIYTSIDPIYFRYVSDHADYGGDIANWPEAFSALTYALMAEEVAVAITQREGTQKRVADALKAARAEARSLDAMQDPTRFAPSGTFVRARMGRQGRLNTSGLGC